MEVNVWKVVAEAVKSGVYSGQGRSRFRVLRGNVKGDQRWAQRKPLAGVPRFDSADSEKNPGRIAAEVIGASLLRVYLS